MPNVQYEYSRELPQGAAARQYTDGDPILCAYECVLLERDTGRQYIYTAVNINTGVKEVLSRRTNPLTTSGVEAMVEKISLSKAAGAGRLQADRPENNRVKKESARLILNAVFRDILPQSGYAIREEQIALALHNLETIERRGVTLAEAEVGTGKTHAYLVPAIIAKRGRINDERNLNLYPGMPYAETMRMPIVIATSSIALQRAILTEYIPQLSQILLAGGVIKEPLTAVLRKGKEHYVCERNLRSHLLFEGNPEVRRVLEGLLLPSSTIDLAEADITPYVKRKISVSGRCSDICPHRETCQYLVFREQARSAKIDIQVCNHNYLLADTLMRAKGQTPLIPNYQILVIDEAHKFLSAARTMYGSELSGTDARGVLNHAERLKFKREGFQNLARRAANKLCDESARLFKGLNAAATVIADETGEDAENRSVEIDSGTARHIRNIRDISSRLLFILRGEAFYCKATELLAWVRKKYDVGTASINLKKLLAEIGDDNATREEQRELMHMQMVRLHQAICALPEIRHKAELEREQRMARKYSYNAERQLSIRQKNSFQETIWKKARKLLPVESASGHASDYVIRLIWEVSRIQEQAATLARHNELICWLEQEDDETKLRAIPKDLNERLFRHRWGKGISTILTSGTLSAAGDFERTKQSLGLEPLGGLLTETTHPSPFDHRENALLYIPENMPFPNGKDKGYISAITDEIERLTIASSGHAAVLFTSYDAMGRVYAALSRRKPSFPMFRLDKGGVKEIERFKASGNGVLFASGALWEGIDIPGDNLSMLIIVKLPFQVPDAISEYERKQYPNFPAYLNSVLVPEMLIKLKQGFGRLIRKEDDTGVIALLDCRANSRGAYRARVLAALPDCPVTADITEVSGFFKTKKQPGYFNQ